MAGGHFDPDRTRRARCDPPPSESDGLASLGPGADNEDIHEVSRLLVDYGLGSIKSSGEIPPCRAASRRNFSSATGSAGAHRAMIASPGTNGPFVVS